MRLSTRQKANLQTDDYLDLLNLATRLGDTKWQQEIIDHLANMQNSHHNEVDSIVKPA